MQLFLSPQRMDRSISFENIIMLFVISEEKCWEIMSFDINFII